MNGIKTAKPHLIFLILSVVLVSGCIVPEGDVFQGIFNPQKPNTIEASADLITVQNLNIIPEPPISAGDSFELSFEVKNNDETHEVDNVAVEQYDTGLCKAGEVTSAPTKDRLIEDTTEVRVVSFTTNCNDNTETTIHLVDSNDERRAEGYLFSSNDQKLCNNQDCEEARCKVTVIDNDRVNLKIGNNNEEYFTTTDRTKNYAGMKITFNGVTSVKKSKCVSSASCERTKADATKACSKYGDDYYVKRISSKTYCYPWYGNRGFDGYCYECDYKSGFTKPTTPSAPEGQTYMPLQTELFEWTFTAPTNDEIGNMPAKCPIRYKISYDFTAKTQVDVTVISPEKIRELQRSGKYEPITPTQTKGIGPIKIDISFGAKQPIKSGDVLPVFITIEDKGTGIYGSVPAGSLKLSVPADFEVKSCSKFEENGDVYENNVDIPMIKKRSPQIRCSFIMPDVTDMRTYYIKAELSYNYQKDYETDITINPSIEK